MATRYFIFEGMQFTTLDVPGNRFTGRETSEPVTASTIDSATENLGQQVIVGASDTAAARLTTMIALWTDTGLTNQMQTFARQALNEDSALIPGTVGDIDDPGNTTARFHLTSDRYILPPKLANGMTAIPDAAGDIADARRRLAVKSISVRHDNIKKHLTAAAAWRVYIRHELAEDGSVEKEDAARAYFVNPPMPPMTSGD